MIGNTCARCGKSVTKLLTFRGKNYCSQTCQIFDNSSILVSLGILIMIIGAIGAFVALIVFLMVVTPSGERVSSGEIAIRYLCMFGGIGSIAVFICGAISFVVGIIGPVLVPKRRG